MYMYRLQHRTIKVKHISLLMLHLGPVHHNSVTAHIELTEQQSHTYTKRKES